MDEEEEEQTQGSNPCMRMFGSSQNRARLSMSSRMYMKAERNTVPRPGISTSKDTSKVFSEKPMKDPETAELELGDELIPTAHGNDKTDSTEDV